MGYGIPVSVFPRDQEGNNQYRIISKYIQRIRKQEDEQLEQQRQELLQQQEQIASTLVDTEHPKPVLVRVASDTDVLLGRGVPIQTHPGNVRLGDLIDSYREEYDNPTLTRGRKTAIAWDIVRTIQDKMGGRFLEKDVSNGSGMWKVVHDDVAREKVSVGFRSKTKMDKRQRRQQRTKQIVPANQQNGNHQLAMKLHNNDDEEVIFNGLFPDDNNEDNGLMLIEETEVNRDKEELRSFRWWSLFNNDTAAETSTLQNDWRTPISVYDDTCLVDNKRRKVVK